VDGCGVEVAAHFINDALTPLSIRLHQCYCLCEFIIPERPHCDRGSTGIVEEIDPHVAVRDFAIGPVDFRSDLRRNEVCERSNRFPVDGGSSLKRECHRAVKGPERWIGINATLPCRGMRSDAPTDQSHIRLDRHPSLLENPWSTVERKLTHCGRLAWTGAGIYGRLVHEPEH
jgi:hypothetical protein